MLRQDSRADAGIQTEIWLALWKAEELRSLDISSMDLKVREGQVWLIGHAVTPYHKRLAGALVEAVPGVRAVHNELVVDDELALQVAQALAADPRTRPHLIPVGASHGWIRLGGDVPSPDVRQAAEEGAASIPGVRGVLALPHLADQTGPARLKSRPVRCSLQPQTGDRVYAKDGPAGSVAEVIINPRSRLVSQVVVDGRFEAGGQYVTGKFVVPAEALEPASRGSLFLSDSLAELAARPAFHEADFPPGPPHWRPPYPYEPGTVRWPEESDKQVR
ncbi:MAG: BON domain-containing protein [Bacteroidota bacterium]